MTLRMEEWEGAREEQIFDSRFSHTHICVRLPFQYNLTTSGVIFCLLLAQICRVSNGKLRKRKIKKKGLIIQTHIQTKKGYIFKHIFKQKRAEYSNTHSNKKGQKIQTHIQTKKS